METGRETEGEGVSTDGWELILRQYDSDGPVPVMPALRQAQDKLRRASSFSALHTLDSRFRGNDTAIVAPSFSP